VRVIAGNDGHHLKKVERMKELMPILALDPATNMGWALSPMISGVWDLSLRRDESMGMKFMRLRAKLNELTENYQIKLVVYEAARNAMPKMQGSLVHQAQLQAIIIDWALLNNIESKGYSPKEIKKWATGNGNASKDAMVAFARKRWPEVTILDDNQADALALWQMATLEYKFLVDAQNGNVAPAIKTVPVTPEVKTGKKKPSAATAAGIHGKIIRAFKRLGRNEDSPEEVEAMKVFRGQLDEAGIPYKKMASLHLSKMLKGEISFALGKQEA
jgi:Holliday junction resolvasome RuvABC endonuclease subunit